MSISASMVKELRERTGAGRLAPGPRVTGGEAHARVGKLVNMGSPYPWARLLVTGHRTRRLIIGENVEDVGLVPSGSRCCLKC